MPRKNLMTLPWQRAHSRDCSVLESTADLHRFVVYQHAVFAGLRHEPGRKVDCVTHDGVFVALGGAHDPTEAAAKGDAHPGADSGRKGRQCLHKLHGCRHGTHSVVRMLRPLQAKGAETKQTLVVHKQLVNGAIPLAINDAFNFLHQRLPRHDGLRVQEKGGALSTAGNGKEHGAQGCQELPGGWQERLAGEAGRRGCQERLPGKKGVGVNGDGWQ